MSVARKCEFRACELSMPSIEIREGSKQIGTSSSCTVLLMLVTVVVLVFSRGREVSLARVGGKGRKEQKTGETL